VGSSERAGEAGAELMLCRTNAWRSSERAGEAGAELMRGGAGEAGAELMRGEKTIK
jgi:hypothetical protein